MTLRNFHLFFILAAIVGAELFGAWSIHRFPSTGEASYLWMGIPTLLGGLGLCVYAYFFVRDMDAAGVH